jgi:hypothetical protein
VACTSIATLNWFGKNYRQTLEPRLYYLYVPEKDQSDIPMFDTGETTFNYARCSATTASSAPTVSVTRTSCRWA